jgi:hypothetical protein
MGAGAPRTNLIIHHGVADILDHPAKPIHILGAVQEPCDLASLCERGEVSESIIECSSKSRASD